eukprot:TRINITY_DN1697_c0_g1_i1.p2 TRINITY_DN1697_c0_g1~~TRINITY_DN1697_c0_g1_i1.p2  ORF type:complete len:274 (+),score=76.29 TRINITY_DN1697_c0_g1_i1:645-1466(+)
MAVTKGDMLELEAAKLFNVTGKIVLVTGGSTGIGYAITQGFVANGCRVYITSRNAKELERVAAELTQAGPGTCVPLAANLAEVGECDRVAREIQQREGKLHILVNNAGATWGAPYAEFTEAAWDKVMTLNVKTVFFLTRACTPLLAAAATPADPARMIATGSVAGFLASSSAETYSYNTSKAAVHHLCRVLASKLASQSITVNAIAAGPFQSKMMKASLAKHSERIINDTALRRIGSAEDIVGLCLWLCSRGGAWVTGTVIPLDGGSLVASKL